MDRADVQKWIEGFVDAWRNLGTDKLEGLFADTVSYQVSPWKQPLQGLTALQAFWEQARSGPDEAFELHSEIVAIEGATAVIRAEVSYQKATPSQWRDLWVVTFGDDGRCRTFQEWPFAPHQDDGQDSQK